LTVCLLTGLPALGDDDAYVALPTQEMLGRYGLELAWWGQADLDPSEDQIEFLTADERLTYVQTRTGLLTAFSSETGREVWSILPGRPHQQSFPVVSNDDLVVLPVGMRMYGINKTTGDILWELQLEHHPSTSPELDASRVFIGSARGNVICYDLRRIQELYAEDSLPELTFLAELWQYQTPGHIHSAPISDGLVVNIACEANTLYAVSAQAAELRFQVETADKITTPMGRNQDSVFLSAYDTLLCLRQVNGTIRWRYPAGAPMEEPARPIGNDVFVNPTEGGLFSISLASGLRRWNQPAARSFLAASGDHVYAEDNVGNVLILSRDDGAIIGSLPLRDYPIRIQNDRTDRLYLGTRSGLVICLREQARAFPMFHRFPERQPIVPILAPDVPADDAADAGAEEAAE
jgi:outer membrane protein assembly factor BamB